MFPAIATATSPLPSSAVSLLTAWEATLTPAQRATHAGHRDTVLTWLIGFEALFAGSSAGVQLDLADVQAVSAGTSGLRVATGAAGGPGRIAAVLRQVLAALPAQPLPCRALLGIAGPSNLQMDELAELTDAIHTTLLHANGELVFGFSEQATAEVQVWLLAGYIL